MPFVLLTSNQFSAMVSLAYNIGIGNFSKSSVLKLHKEGTINIIVDNLLDENHWDRTLKIDIKDLSVYGAVKLVVEPLMVHAKYDTIRMLSNNVIEFWWD